MAKVNICIHYRMLSIIVLYVELGTEYLCQNIVLCLCEKRYFSYICVLYIYECVPFSTCGDILC